MLVNLAIADIMYSAFLFPDFILKYISTHPDGMTGKLLCILLTGGNLAWVGASSSVVTLVAIAVERYYAVIYPHGNKGKLTMRKLKDKYSERKVVYGMDRKFLVHYKTKITQHRFGR